MNIAPDRKLGSVSGNQTIDHSGKINGHRFQQKQADLPRDDKQTESAVPPGISAGFQKSDLKNPTQVDQMVATTLNQLLETDFSGLHSSDRRAISNWMGKDPIIRSLILRRFERVLT